MSDHNPCTDLKVKLYCDAANLDSLLAMYSKPYVQGFTTNPSLMRKAGVQNYEAFAKSVIEAIPDRPVSFEVLADDEMTMEWQARRIACWGKNVYVKVPVTNSTGFSMAPLVRRLARDGVKVNVTAVMTLDQVKRIAEALDLHTPSIVSIFAGRIADTGIDPVPIMGRAAEMLSSLPKAELLWASSRELLNIYHAEQSGTHIITATPDILGKIGLIGKDLSAFSLETVRMLYEDAVSANFRLEPIAPARVRELVAAQSKLRQTMAAS